MLSSRQTATLRESLRSCSSGPAAGYRDVARDTWGAVQAFVLLIHWRSIEARLVEERR